MFVYICSVKQLNNRNYEKLPYPLRAIKSRKQNTC